MGSASSESRQNMLRSIPSLNALQHDVRGMPRSQCSRWKETCHMNHVATLLTDVAKARSKVWCFHVIVVTAKRVLVGDICQLSACEDNSKAWY